MTKILTGNPNTIIPRLAVANALYNKLVILLRVYINKTAVLT